MAVPPLDLKSIHALGKTYSDWLGATKNARMREEMDRIYAEVSIPESISARIQALKRRVHILAIIEDWCGDVRRHAPVLARLCDLNTGALILRCVDKETRPELMVRYLTNGAEAIPIFVFMNDNFVEVGNWGPRPAECKRFMARGKAAGNVDAAREKIMAFYQADKHQSTIAELDALLDITSA